MSSSWTFELEAGVPAPRLFKAAVLDWHNLGPKIAPEKIVSAVTEGDAGAGSTRQFNFAPGAPFSFVKERVDFLDVANCEAKSTLVEGGGLGTHVESSSVHITIEPKAGGCVVKVVGTYTAMPGVNAAEETEKAKALLTGIMRGCEAYLAVNPDAYN